MSAKQHHFSATFYKSGAVMNEGPIGPNDGQAQLAACLPGEDPFGLLGAQLERLVT